MTCHPLLGIIQLARCALVVPWSVLPPQHTGLLPHSHTHTQETIEALQRKLGALEIKVKEFAATVNTAFDSYRFAIANTRSLRSLIRRVM